MNKNEDVVGKVKEVLVEKLVVSEKKITPRARLKEDLVVDSFRAIEMTF